MPGRAAVAVATMSPVGEWLVVGIMFLSFISPSLKYASYLADAYPAIVAAADFLISSHDC